ncbi:metal-dependent hydrolase [Herbaspirillum sp. HC18]|nr:metal-dependent hydrolase [Herbaspirillum sp. HC18]
MDNFSHSVAGLAVGEYVHRSLAPESDAERQGLRRRLLLIAAWAASNLPDLDLFLTPLLPAPLGYLLHHRGHTHTFLYAIPQALALWALLLLAWPSARALVKASTSARRGLIAAIGAGLVLHILMDFLNSYGIHPFHPFDSRWLYGDMVFILEPVFWVAFGVPMAMMVPSRILKTLLLVLLVGAPLLFTVKGFLSVASFVALALCAVVTGTLVRFNGMRALRAAFLIVAAFVVSQHVASGAASRIVTDAIHQMSPQSRVLDTAMTAFPAHPLCWSFASIEDRQAENLYIVRRGVVSVAPGILPVSHCPAGIVARMGETTGGDAVSFVSAHQGDLAALRRLKDGNCHVEAWLRFARIPWIGNGAASDFRFGPDAEDNFTTLRLADFEGRECGRWVPQWGLPRLDLLR